MKETADEFARNIVDCASKETLIHIVKEYRLLEGIVKHYLKQQRFQLTDNDSFKRQLGNIAKELDCNAEDLQKVMEPLFRQLVDEMFGTK